jgi:hypothetical protein
MRCRAAWKSENRNRRHVIVGILAAAVGVEGCGVTGAWKTIDVQPAGAPFPVNQVTFDPQGSYAAQGFFTPQGAYDGHLHDSKGTYRWKGRRLELAAADGPPLTYRTRRRLDGRLVMTLQIPGQPQTITATLSRADE